jgi:hypothetical protein
MKSTPITFRVIVRNPNSWTQNQDGSSRQYEITAECGHKHRTVETAQACLSQLTAWYCNCGELSNSHRRCSSSTGHTANHTSARWYHAQIEDSTGQQL